MYSLTQRFGFKNRKILTDEQLNCNWIQVKSIKYKLKVLNDRKIIKKIIVTTRGTFDRFECSINKWNQNKIIWFYHENHPEENIIYKKFHFAFIIFNSLFAYKKLDHKIIFGEKYGNFVDLKYENQQETVERNLSK